MIERSIGTKQTGSLTYAVRNLRGEISPDLLVFERDCWEVVMVTRRNYDFRGLMPELGFEAGFEPRSMSISKFSPEIVEAAFEKFLELSLPHFPVAPSAISNNA